MTPLRIEESLRAISCTKPSSKRNKGAKNAGLSAADSEAFVGNDFEQAPGDLHILIR